MINVFSLVPEHIREKLTLTDDKNKYCNNKLLVNIPQVQFYQIVVLQQGRIVERGTHSELLGLSSGIYRNYWQLQSSQKKVPLSPSQNT